MPTAKLPTPSPWHVLRAALATLALAVLAGCFVFEDEVVLLDTSTSRIPLVAQGVWLTHDKSLTLVIDTADGRIGRMYMLRSKRDGKPEELTQVSFLMAPVGGNDYLIMLTGNRANIKSKKGYGPRAEKTVTVWRIERNTIRMVLANRSSDEKVAAQLAALSRKNGVLLEDDNVKGHTDLAAFKRFVADATQASFLAAPSNQYQRQRWLAVDWQHFDALRAQLDRNTQTLKNNIEQALREPPSSQAQERLGKLLDNDSDSDNSSLAATPEGMLLLAQASRRASPEASAETLDKLELHTRLQAAAYGHVPSQLWVGRHYETRGTHPLDDLRAAIRWYGLAATAGDAEGAAGEMRLKGRFGGLGLK